MLVVTMRGQPGRHLSGAASRGIVLKWTAIAMVSHASLIPDRQTYIRSDHREDEGDMHEGEDDRHSGAISCGAKPFMGREGLKLIISALPLIPPTHPNISSGKGTEMPLTFENRHTPIWQTHYYRSEYGDAGYKATPHFEQPDHEELKALLLDRFANPKRRIKPPISADVLDDDGNVVMSARMITPYEAEISPLPK